MGEGAAAETGGPCYRDRPAPARAVTPCPRRRRCAVDRCAGFGRRMQMARRLQQDAAGRARGAPAREGRRGAIAARTAPGSPRRARVPHFARASAIVLLILTACQSTPPDTERPSKEEQAGGTGPGPLHEIVHRHVLGDPRLDECLEERSGGPDVPLEIDLQAVPSGELTLLQVKGGIETTTACVRDALARIRLPAGSVSEGTTITVSVR